MKMSYKIVIVAPLMALTMGACKTYINTVTGTFDGKKILVENAEGEERLIDCTKKTDQTEQLLKDIPYFRVGDQIKLKQKTLGINYDGHRVVSTEDYQVVYPLDTIQIRKDQEIIAKEKAAHVR